MCVCVCVCVCVGVVSDGKIIQFIFFISQRYFTFFISRVMNLLLKCKKPMHTFFAESQKRFNTHTSHCTCFGPHWPIIMESKCALKQMLNFYRWNTNIFDIHAL